LVLGGGWWILLIFELKLFGDCTSSKSQFMALENDCYGCCCLLELVMPLFYLREESSFAKLEPVSIFAKFVLDGGFRKLVID
jgi:hypothetical protein